MSESRRNVFRVGPVARDSLTSDTQALVAQRRLRQQVDG
jgi:hypothetical protein